MTESFKTIQELIGALPEHGDAPAIITFQKEEVRTLSYRQLFHDIAALAAGLSELMKNGDRTVAVCGSSTAEWIKVAFAVMYAGGIILPVDQQADGETLKHIFNDSSARILFADSDRAEKIEKLELKQSLQVYLLDVEKDDDKSWRSLLAEDPAEPRGVEPDDPTTLFYTSGTTGPPKGVELSHANLATQPAAVKQTDLITREDRVLLPLPLHHVYPFVIGILTPLALGLPVILPMALTGREIIRAIKDGEATIIIGVPRLYRTFYDGIRSRLNDRGKLFGLFFSVILALCSYLREHFGLLAGRRLLSFIHNRFGPSLRVLASGGSALDPALARSLEGLGWEVAVGYGLTETSPLITINPPGSGRLQSVGRPIGGVEIKIAPVEQESGSKEEKENTGDNGGELLVRGPNVFRGYLNLDDKTAEAFTDDGWFRTGDLGRFDDENFLYLHGRAKTLIVTESGKNLQPDEIEEAYAEHPAISELGVFLNDGQLTGIIVPDLKNIGDTDDSIEDVVRKAVAEQSKKLPGYKSLADYRISRESLSRTRLGKIKRHLLEERYEQAKEEEKDDGGKKEPIELAAMSDHDQALMEDNNVEKVWRWLADRFSNRRLTPDSSPRFDLGIDSLEWLDISLEVQQRTGIELSEEIIGRIETVRDLLEEISSLSESDRELDPERPLREPESVLDDEQKIWLEPLGPVLSKLSFAAFLLNKTVMKLCFRLQVRGRENLPHDKQCLIAPNHLSLLDPLVLAAAIPYDILRSTFFAGWTGIAFRNFIFRFFSRLAQAVPIDTRQAASSLAFGSAVLERNNNLIWFPEGARSRDGSLQEFKPGISLILSHHDPAVVPVYIKGTYEAMPMGAKFPRFRKVTVIFGKPVSPRELGNKEKEGEELRDSIRQGLQNKVAQLIDQLEGTGSA